MITSKMENCIKIVCIAHGIKYRRLHYVNLWSMRKIVPFLLARGVPQWKIDLLFKIYNEIRFG